MGLPGRCVKRTFWTWCITLLPPELPPLEDVGSSPLPCTTGHHCMRMACPPPPPLPLSTSPPSPPCCSNCTCSQLQYWGADGLGDHVVGHKSVLQTEVEGWGNIDELSPAPARHQQLAAVLVQMGARAHGLSPPKAIPRTPGISKKHSVAFGNSSSYKMLTPARHTHVPDTPSTRKKSTIIV